MMMTVLPPVVQPSLGDMALMQGIAAVGYRPGYKAAMETVSVNDNSTVVVSIVGDNEECLPSNKNDDFTLDIETVGWSIMDDTLMSERSEVLLEVNDVVKYTRVSSRSSTLHKLLKNLNLPPHWIRLMPLSRIREQTMKIDTSTSKSSYVMLISLGSKVINQLLKLQLQLLTIEEYLILNH